MQEIKCPNCGEVFVVDESGYAQIVQQVRDKEFDKELRRREEELAGKQESELRLLRLEQKQEYDAALAKKETELQKRDQLIARLQAQISGTETEKKLAVAEVVSEKDRELSEKTTEITALKSQLANKATENELKEQALQKQYEEKLKMKDEQIEYYKDFKARQSTKMIGESLEQHCLNQFNALRMTAFPNAYFEKDNDARTGSKGDFIFREAADGVEFISIMFEMKNEMDETATKHKNEDFFKELDKDRNEKGCEYAVLVSMLEADNEFYNAGIVDVSYKYPKMYVIRPQFFIPLISLLRNAARNSLEYKRELAMAKAQQVDLTNFEKNITDFKTAFAKNYNDASNRFKDAITGIDATIDKLGKIKQALLLSEDHLRLANKKAEEQLTIKKLTKNAPSIKEEFARLASEQTALPGGADE